MAKTGTKRVQNVKENAHFGPFSLESVACGGLGACGALLFSIGIKVNHFFGASLRGRVDNGIA